MKSLLFDPYEFIDGLHASQCVKDRTSNRDVTGRTQKLPVKGHLLVVTDDKRVLLKHRKELCASNIIIAVSETNNAGDITSTLFQ